MNKLKSFACKHEFEVVGIQEWEPVVHSTTDDGDWVRIVDTTCSKCGKTSLYTQSNKFKSNLDWKNKIKAFEESQQKD